MTLVLGFVIEPLYYWLLFVNHYRLILPQYAAMVLSFHMSHSDIAFVVKFKFNEGGSEIGWGAVPHHGASASRLIYQDIFFVSGLFIWDQ